MKIFTTLLFIGFSFFLFSCKGDATNAPIKDADSTTETIINASNLSNEEQLDELKIQKLNILIGIFNDFSRATAQTYARYVDSYGDNPEKYQDIGKFSMLGLEEVTQLDQLDEALTIDILNELNPLIKSFKSKGELLGRKINDLHDYYEMGDNVADKNQKGQVGHKELLLAYYDFFDVNKVLVGKTKEIQSDIELAQLKQLKADGETLRYLIGFSLNRSQNLMAVSQKEEYENLDASEVEQAYLEVRAIFDEMKSFKKNNEEEFASVDELIKYFRTFKGYTMAGFSLVNRLKNKEPYSTGEKMLLKSKNGGGMVQGSVPKLLLTYNKLVDNYNDIMN